MSIDWSIVKREHVIKACSLYASGQRRPTHPARNTFLVLQGEKYPAKFIRGLAYELAVGHRLNPSEDYSGGVETARFLTKLGFEVEYRSDLFSLPTAKQSRSRNQGMTPSADRKGGLGLDPVSQKLALEGILRDRYGDIQKEATFDWLIVPSTHSMDKEIAAIADALTSYRGQVGFFKPGVALKCDFFVPSMRYIIEYDERQHFTIPRDLSLSLYPDNLKLGFDLNQWRESCQRIRAEDPNPPYRDEQRAFYDTLRDLLAVRNGYYPIRIKHGDYDWTSKSRRKGKA